MTEEEAIEILRCMNDGYTFQNCKVCVSDNKFNEKKGICESKTCEYLNAIDIVIQALEQKDKHLKFYEKHESYKARIIELQEEIERRNIIINELIQEYEYNVGINIKNFCDEEIRKDKCIQDCICCIKQYFEEKVLKSKN